jgi:hypothetical protein
LLRPRELSAEPAWCTMSQELGKGRAPLWRQNGNRGISRVVGQAFQPDVRLKRLTYFRTVPLAGQPSMTRARLSAKVLRG